MGAPQIPSRHKFSATTPLTLPDGDATQGGVYLVIDSIVASGTADASARTMNLTLTAGGGSVLVALLALPASTAGSIALPFPSGFPVVGTDGNPLTTISLALTGTGVTVNGIAVDYHYRRFNG